MAIPIRAIAKNSIDVIYETFGEIVENVIAYPGIRQNINRDYNTETGEVVTNNSEIKFNFRCIITNTDIKQRADTNEFDDRDLMLIAKVVDIENAIKNSVSNTELTDLESIKLDVDWRIERTLSDTNSKTVYFVKSVKLDPTNTFYEGIIRSLE